MRALLSLGLLLAVGCAPILAPQALGDADRVRETPALQEAKALAPAAFAKAEKLRKEAHAAFEGEDLAGAQIIAEEALAAYEEAVAIARVARAEEALVASEAEAADGVTKLTTIEADLARVEAEVLAAERRLEVLRGLEPFTPSDDADPKREKARATALATLALEARLLCAAADLLAAARASESGFSAPTAAMKKAKDRLATFDAELGKEPQGKAPKKAPIDEARRVRASCLESLTAVRRVGSQAAARERGADALLAALSEANVGAPRRDDRGVVVTLRAFDGDGLGAKGKKLIDEAVAIGKKHPAFPVMVVTHHRDDDATRWERRGKAVVQQMRTELGTARVADAVSAGAAAPLVDPKGQYKADNHRVEVVFVSPRSL